MNRLFLSFTFFVVLTLSFISCKDDKDSNITYHDYLGPTTELLCEEKNTSFGETNGVEYVDLGLPSGNLWATMNIGASKLEDFGDFFSWGETTPKEKYLWDNYKFHKKETIVEGGHTDYIYGFIKYIPEEEKALGYEGFFDNKITLDLTDDVAHAQLGGSWRMPTWCDYEELLQNCVKKWDTYHGVKGYRFTASNGMWIFFPAAGYSIKRDELGFYWCGSSNYLGPGYADSFLFSLSCCMFHNELRYIGCSARAVCPVKK